MDIRNCKSCGKLFNYLSGPPLCPSCAKVLDEKFAEVKEYVYDNPGVGIQQVSEDMDVPIPQIKQWIREERLAFAEDSMIGLECEGCGATIKTGRYCKACKEKLAKGFNDLYPVHNQQQEDKEKDLHDNPKMRFLNQSEIEKQ